MKRTFVSALRLLGRLARGPVSRDLTKAIEDSYLLRGYLLREEINATFDRVRSLADGVPFEFGATRSSDLELRARIRTWAPQLRAPFLMRIALLKYRLQMPGFELPDAVRVRHEAYDDASARMLEEMADRVENRLPGNCGAEEEIEMKQRLHDAEAEIARQLPASQAQSILTLLRSVDALTDSLAAEIAWVDSRLPLFAFGHASAHRLRTGTAPARPRSFSCTCDLRSLATLLRLRFMSGYLPRRPHDWRRRVN